MKHTTLSKRKRIIYLILCFIAFLILSPLAAYYATGYRFDDKFEVTKTGGIYVVIEGKGFSIFLNDKEQEVSSIFRRDFFIQNLAPGVYSLQVRKEGYYFWFKKIIVTQEKVTDVRPFNLEEKIEVISIPKKIISEKDVVESKEVASKASSTNASTTNQSKNSSNNATTTKKETDNEEYIFVRGLFATSSKRLVEEKITASSTKDDPKHVILYRKVALWSSYDEIFAEWRGGNNNAPVYFCYKEECLSKMSVFRGAKVITADMLTDSFVIFATESGVYVTELDGRGGRNVQPLVLGTGYDFRVFDDETIYLKKDKMFYKVTVSL